MNLCCFIRKCFVSIRLLTLKLQSVFQYLFLSFAAFCFSSSNPMLRSRFQRVKNKQRDNKGHDDERARKRLEDCNDCIVSRVCFTLCLSCLEGISFYILWCLSIRFLVFLQLVWGKECFKAISRLECELVLCLLFLCLFVVFDLFWCNEVKEV